MLQRIQSVLLLVTALCLVVFLGTNSYEKVISSSEKVIVNPFHVVHSVGNLGQDKPIYYIAVLASFALLCSIYTIFQYKNRVRQLLLVAFNSLMIGAALAIMVYHIQNDALHVGSASIEGNYQIGIWAAFVALASNWVANRFIKRDEKLVKDADRLR